MFFLQHGEKIDLTKTTWLNIPDIEDSGSLILILLKIILYDSFFFIKLQRNTCKKLNRRINFENDVIKKPWLWR